jgi:hypothetical protein
MTMTMSSGAADIAPPPASGAGGPALVAQSLTTGEIPADTSGDTDDYLFNTSSGLDDSVGAEETTFEDSAGYFDEEVIEEDTEEYDEEEIVEDDEMVEEVIDSEHASDHDLVEEVVEAGDEEADKEKLGHISEAAVEEEEELEATEHSEKADVAGDSLTDLPAVQAGNESHVEPRDGDESGHVSASNLGEDNAAPSEALSVDKLQQSSSSMVPADPVGLQNSKASIANELEQSSHHEQLLQGSSNHENLQQSSSSLMKAAAGPSTSSLTNENQRSTSSIAKDFQQINSPIANELQGSTTSEMNVDPLTNASATDALSQGDPLIGHPSVDVLPAASTESDEFYEAGDSPSSKAEASQDEYVTVDDVVASPVSYSRPAIDAQNSGIVAESLMVGSAVAVAASADTDASAEPTTSTQPPPPPPSVGEVRRPPSPTITRSAWLDEEEPSDEGGGRLDEMATVASVPPSVPTISEGDDELSGASDHRSVQGATNEDANSSLLPTETDLDQSEASIYSSQPAPEDAGELEASTRSMSSAPAVCEGPEDAEEDPSGYMEQTAFAPASVAGDQFMSAGAPSEHSVPEETVAVPAAAYSRGPFEEATESSYASENADAVGYGGAMEAAGSFNKGEVEEDASTRNDVETAIEKPQDPMKMYDPDADASLDDSPRRKLRLADYALVICILVVFLVLIITLPIVLTNQNKNRDLPTSQVRKHAATMVLCVQERLLTYRFLQPANYSRRRVLQHRPLARTT